MNLHQFIPSNAPDRFSYNMALKLSEAQHEMLEGMITAGLI